jgi:hypothetical protein
LIPEVRGFLLRRFPELVQLVYFFLTIEIDPDHHWRNVAMMLAEVFVCEEHAAVAL